VGEGVYLLTQCVNKYAGGESMPAKNEPEVLEEEVVVEEPGILESLRRVLLASVGVVALTIEEVGDLVDKLVERGEIAEQEGKKLVNEIKEKRQKKAGEAEDMAAGRMREMMDKMDVPTKSDIVDLSAKIATLSKKVDELKKAQSQ
jgi:poly(hydroxyalkanoate) granule-associated protein